VTMTTLTRPAPFFIGDDKALDFLNSVATPAGSEIDWLANGKDLIAWLQQADLLPAEAAARLVTRRHRQVLDATAEKARELREWFRAFVHDHAGKPIESSALNELAPINKLLERDEIYRQIAHSESGEDPDGRRALRWRAQRHWHSAETLLLPIADAIGNLVCEKDFSLVRKCEGPACTLWFLDVSKAHARRWCSMAVCGNRAKAAAHRARARGSAEAAH
jgi:predicted RNA-binding Zn ribbon-like protein